MLRRLSHPVAQLSQQALAINNGQGYIEQLKSSGERGSLCSDFMVHAKVAFSPWNTSATTICISVLGQFATDVYGQNYPDFRNCSTLQHRLVTHVASVVRTMQQI